MSVPVNDAVAASEEAWQPRPYRVVSRKRETHDTVTIGLVPVDGEPEPVRPGQFVMLSAFGVGEIPLSVSGYERRRSAQLHTIRAGGAISTALCQASPGTVVGLRGPFGTAWAPGDANADLIVVAGGLGLAPLRLAIVEAIAASVPDRRVVLLVGARSPADVLFSRDLEEWSRRPGVAVAVTVDRSGLGWPGHVGLVTELVRRASFAPGSARALVCGPEVMMRFTVVALVERGVPLGRISVSLERNMKCGIGLCGHCQLGPLLVCRDGPVVSAERAFKLMGGREL